MSDPDSGQKALPHPPEGFLVFFGARRRRVGGLGRASPYSSSRSGTLVGQATRGEPAEPNLRAAAPAADPGQKKRFVCLRDDTRTKEFAQVRSSFAVTRRCLLLPFASDIF